MYAEATKEEEARHKDERSKNMWGEIYVQERYPGDVLDERAEDAPLPKTVLEERVAEVASAGEHDGAGEPDLERVHVIPVDFERPSKEEIVEKGE